MVTQEERDKLFLERRKKRLTLDEVANYVGCHKSLISKFELGECGMSDEKVERYREIIAT
ncbi:helix-turn-helix domain-containing protein [Natranaerobius thermophilus]|uniref:HTH cro/C1-type domain-containing protein n=1 Tax=Natranaerobius thermophilus (strain ATCC BAA-1301 / DSM 18059 / JW/NM-WN-LF) TaxID=457570 RepID=B2A214_NATTJ|nr:helix-turn-helix transcriptional regulator [Natranaerobius thermophilus]ACB84819.1 conserved hypothetical protein [Natranaerobius thermophilus JW/NM-WN-LF]